VTASDISARALERVAAASRLRGVSVEQLQVDANALDAFGPEQYDLVSAQYASIPRTPDRRGIRNLLDAVAPGGALLVVNHDPAAMAEVRDRQPFDPDAYVSIDEFLAVLADSEGWQVEVNEKRPRPPGAASHHVDDVVLRARRLERVPATRAAHAHSQGSAGRRRQRT
ncbi:MAG TPA: class I SAM-dependent methyltransferase, partial [Jatrophihabitans sp.]|nr:class I SAM-dependent methyltransferase [Jatrophihabitans sp.]